jgi:hypothetical protein
MSLSDRSWTLLINGEVACVFGLAGMGYSGMLLGVGAPWALTADLAASHPRQVYEASREVLAHFRTLYPTLCNAIHSRNDRALRWARKVGFRVSEVGVPLGYDGELFHPILMGER